jgi:hypothetical protein
VKLDPEKARHIDYGYTVESAQHHFADRVVLTGESSQLAEQQTALTKLNPHIREVGIYTSDGKTPIFLTHGIATDVRLAEQDCSVDSGLSSMPEAKIPEIEFEGIRILISPTRLRQSTKRPANHRFSTQASTVFILS